MVSLDGGWKNTVYNQFAKMSNQSFGASFILKVGFILALIGSPLFAWWMAAQGEPLLVQAVFLSPFFVVLKAWPRAILLDDEGITQRALFGRIKRIRYHEIEEMTNVYAVEGEVESVFIVNGGGEEIRHGWLHRDRDEFIKVLQHRTGKEPYGWCSPEGAEEVITEIQADGDAENLGENNTHR